jgi:zinc protease
LVNLQWIVRGGSGALDARKAGLAALAADLLDEGAEGRSSQEIARALEDLGAHFHSAAGVDATEVELNVLASRLPAALDVASDLLLRPTFPAAEVERLQAESLAGLEQDLEDPSTQAAFAFARCLF